jgi:hypothetical protein
MCGCCGVGYLLLVEAEEGVSSTFSIGAVIPALGAGIHAFLSRRAKGVDPATKSQDNGVLAEVPAPI